MITTAPRSMVASAPSERVIAVAIIRERLEPHLVADPQLLPAIEVHLERARAELGLDRTGRSSRPSESPFARHPVRQRGSRARV